MKLLRGASAAVACAGLATSGASASDFATVVHEYRPAPGQFVNAPGYNDPAKALGAPVGGGAGAADLSKLVTLGGFGGSITLGFDEPIMDDPCNPMGLDAIVFGSAFWAGNNPNRRWAQAATIEISRDVNGDGIPNDPWYVIPGSSLPTPPAGALRTQMWDANAGTPTPPADPAWYPAPPAFPEWPAQYTTSAYELPAAFAVAVLVNPNGAGASVEGHYGYAGLAPTLRLGDMSGAHAGQAKIDSLNDPEDMPGIDPALFYSVPDDPVVVGVDPGSGGGDAFDIAWAVDPATGAPAKLDRFDFIRITTAVDAVLGPIGELSTEVGGVARVRSRASSPGDATGDGAVNFSDLNAVLNAFGQQGALMADVNCDGVVNFADLNEVLNNFGSVTR